MSAQRWPRDVWAEAVWSSDLPPVQRLVALAYADHARDGDSAWLAGTRLRDRTGLGRTAGAEAVRRLAVSGWLVPLDRPRKGHTATYRLVVPGAEKAVSRPTEKAVSRPTDGAEGRLAATEGRLATREGRLAAPTAVPTSGLTSSLPGASPSAAADSPAGARETTTGDEDDFGARAVAALGRADLTASQLERLRDQAARRLGQVLACDAAYAVAARSKTSPAGYMKTLSDDELRALAEERRHERERPARPLRPAAPPRCDDPRCGPTRRLEDPDTKDDLGKCPACHPSALRRRGAA